MDNNIRQLLVAASQQTDAGDEGSFLDQAYGQLKTAAESKSSLDGGLPFGQDLFVICSEVALQRGESTVAQECLKMFFMKTPPQNQFLCRAYLCHAQLLAPVSAEDKVQLDKAVVFILKAINFARSNTRYHFLVYNASVLYWQFCRPFLKPTYRRCLSGSLHSVVKALDDVNDSNHEWRAQLMIALVECHIDAGHLKEAGEVSKVASDFTKSNVPSLYKQVLALQIRYNLVDSAKLAKDVRQSSDLTAFYRIMKLRVGLEQQEITDVQSTMGKLISQLLKEEDLSRPSSVLGAGGRKTPVEERPNTTTEGVSRGPSSMSLIQAANTANDVGRHTKQTGSTTTPEPLSAKEHKSVASKWKVSATPIGEISIGEKPRLLLEMAYLCSEYNQPELLKKCLDGMKTFIIKDKTVVLSMEFLECELMVRSLGFAQEMYTKNSVEVRLLAVERLTEAVTNAIRHGDPDTIQIGCVTMWNICLPLLQSNIREKIRKPLTLIADALESIDSLLILLRCQLHTELAKIEEDEDQIELAMEHLKKAIGFDDGGQYTERLQASLHRLQLRGELYKPPERAEDKAAMIIEQARKSSESGTVRMKRSLLVQAGQALSPDAFLLVLESESETKGKGSGVQTLYSPLGSKAEHYKKCVRKAEGHIIRLGTENDKERARLWADLAKTSRKQEVWDVCRVAARFCLLFDDDRWQVQSRSETRQDSDPQPPSSEATGSKRAKSPSLQSVTAAEVSNTERDLIRMLVEINFLNSEAQIHLLRSENVDLKNEPIPPVDTSKKPKGYVAKKPEDNEDWNNYREWICNLSESCLKGFIRAAELGVQLNEPWAVCSATAYVWNYCSHILQANRHREMVPYFKTLLGYLRQVGHAGESCLIVNLCNALAIGLLTPWIPIPQSEVEEAPSPTPRGKGSREDGTVRKAKSVTSHTSTKSKTVLTDPEAMGELKQALEVCEFALNVSSGDKHVIVPVAVKHSLLMTWVKVKQLLSQQVSKTLGSDDEDNKDGQTFVTRCLVSLEMLTLNGNGLMTFKEAPILEELCNMVDGCQWPDILVELQVWTRISQLALKSRNHPLVLRCSEKALTFDLPDRIRRVDSHRQMVSYEMLSHAANLLAQSYILGMTAGKNTMRRQALEAFVRAAKYAKKAGNAGLVITAARRYWNACLPLVTEPMERQLLKQPLAVILDCLSATIDKRKPQKNESQGKSEKPPSAVSSKSSSDSLGDKGTAMGDILSNTEDDLTLRAAMYGVLFQSYIDQGEYEEGLAAMDKAISDMPRTKHRLLIFKHRLMVKAKLGRDIHVDIAKFKDESEDYVAMLWYKIASLSQDKGDQITAYQNAINSLKLPSSDWQKVEYILAFTEWLYINEFPLEACIDQIDWAIDILLNMKVETTQRGNGSAKNNKTRKGRNSASQKSHASLQGDQGMSEVNDLTSDPSNIILGITQLRSVKLLDHMIRAHVMLALMADRGSSRHQEACLMAWGLLHRIWQVSVPSAACVAKELAKTAALQEQQASNKNSPKGKRGAPKDVKAAKAPEPPKPKHKGPLDALPSIPEEWACYELPEEIREAFKEDDSGEGINKDTITKPTLSLYYLLKLVTEMRAAGYNHLVFPALTLAEVIARDICSSNTSGNTCRLIAMEVCTELNLTEAAKFHENAVGSPGLSDAEQASSREETALLQEKQAQVERESERTLELQRQMLLSSQDAGKPMKKISNIVPPDQKSVIEESIEGLGEHLSAAVYRQTWTQQAEILIRLGFYQAAREFLNEALASAKAFSDDYSLVCILTNQAELAFSEGEYKECINILIQAQMLRGHEELWLRNTQLLVNATLADIDDKKRYIKAEAALTKALSTFIDLKESRPNKSTKLRCIIAEIKAKLASVQLDQMLKDGKRTLQPMAHSKLFGCCEVLQDCSSEFIMCGHKRRAVEIMDQHATTLRLLARDASDKETRHGFLLQAYSILKQAVDMLDLELTKIVTLTPSNETSTLSLPLEREASAIKSSFAELLMDIFAIYAQEHRQKRIQETRKTSIEKMVADYTAMTPDLTDTEKEWQLIAGLTGQTAIVHLTTAVTLAGPYAPLKAKSLLNLGRCFHALGDFYSPSPAHQWDVHYLNLMNRVAQSVETEETGDDVTIEKKQSDKIERMTTKFKFEQETSEKYIAQAMEVLNQCLKVSLQENLKEVIGEAALELVECCGQFDQPLATQYLALYQSCKASQSMEETLSRAQQDPRTSQQASLLHQQRIMTKLDVRTNWSCSSMATAIRQNLNDASEAWRRLKIVPNHLDMMKEFPANFNIIILQHTDDRSVLYGALMERPKPPAGKESGKGKGIPTDGPSRARVIKVSVDPMAIENLMQCMKQHKSEVMQTLLKLQFRKSQQAQRLQMLENLTDDMKESIKDSSEDSVNAEQLLQESFTQILKDLEDYLRPVTTFLEPVLSDFDSASSTVGKDSSNQPPEECVIILADELLLELPLEALSLFSSQAITSVSRDFSLQMLYHRLHQEPEAVGDDVDDKKKKAAAAAAAKEKAAKEKDKSKAIKMVPIDRSPPPHCIPLDTNGFKYIIDPYCDVEKSDDVSPIKITQDALLLYQNQFTARWEGIMGDDHVPSLGEWEQQMTDCGSFIFYGMERFLSHLPAFKIAPMDLTECNMVVLLDMAQTSGSFMRQSKVDVEKSPNDLSLERPVDTAMLLSLAGVNCVLANQWHCGVTDNAQNFKTMLKTLLETGRTPGQTVRQMFAPDSRPEGDEATNIEESATPQGKDGGTRRDSKSAGSKASKTSKSGQKRKHSTERRQSKVQAEVKTEELVVTKEVPKSQETVKRNWYNVVCYGLPNLMVANV